MIRLYYATRESVERVSRARALVRRFTMCTMFVHHSNSITSRSTSSPSPSRRRASSASIRSLEQRAQFAQGQACVLALLLQGDVARDVTHGVRALARKIVHVFFNRVANEKPVDARRARLSDAIDALDRLGFHSGIEHGLEQ